MFIFDSIIEINSQLITYMVVYNISLVLFFVVIFNSVLSDVKHFSSIPSIVSNSFNRIVVTIILLSMAGVPPFIGFFSKLFILSLIVDSSFFLFYWLLFGIFFLGLYFYTQNIRALHVVRLLYKNLPYIFTELLALPYSHRIFIFSYFLILGLFFIEDFCEAVVTLII